MIMHLSFTSTAADHLWDFAFRMGYNLHEMEALGWYLDEYMEGDQFAALVEEHLAYIDLIRKAEEYGLLELTDPH